jgi:thiamine-phosphate pyrophosphorylase
MRRPYKAAGRLEGWAVARSRDREDERFMDAERCRLYLLTPPAIDDGFADRLAAALDAGDVGAVQLRLKDCDDDAVKRAAERLLPVCHARDRPLIVNDRPDLAAATGADGVHVGQQDAPYAAARKLLGAERIVGVTCHASIDLAYEAAEAGADYVAFGAFFASGTKENPAGRADVALLRQWSETITVPCVAIGGITTENCGDLVAAGADFLAVIGAVWSHPAGPAAAVKAFNAAIAEHAKA